MHGFRPQPCARCNLCFALHPDYTIALVWCHTCVNIKLTLLPPALQLRRLSLNGGSGRVSELQAIWGRVTLDRELPHQLSTLIGLETLQVLTAPTSARCATWSAA